MRSSLSGTLRLPTDAGYEVTSQLFDRRFDGVRPAAVATVRSTADVQQAVRFATAHGIGLRTRAGGHSYSGASVGTGLVVDLRGMASISPGTGTATVGAGAQLIDVYSQLAAAGVSVPGGSCPSVGLAGLALGGGQGVVSRTYGLACDVISSMQVVLADGSLVTASATSEPDLFWALRGAGASYGIVTSFVLKTHATQALSTSYHAFPWASAADVLAAWSAHLPVADRAVWSTCHVLASPKGQPPVIEVACVRVGSSPGLEAALQPFLAAVGTSPTSAEYRDRTYLATMLLEAGCAETSVAACHLAGQSPAGTLGRDAFVAGSAYFTAPLSAASAAALVAAVPARQDDPALGGGGASFDTWGGATADVAPDATAFVHRDVTYGAQYTASWLDTPGNGPLAANQVSLAAMMAPLSAVATGAAYQNYADTSLVDPQTAYYGANLSRLQKIKKAYDPDNVFAPPQGITPA